jgi:Nif-specific regulatory protein
MDASPIFKTLDEVKREHVLNVLKAMEGDRAAAAKALAIGKRTLDMHLLDWGIVKPNQRTRKATVAASEDQR